MLAELTIRNFAVIRDTRIEFLNGFNALTGETGAGKSIVIDALGAVLGARTSSEFVRTGQSSAYVEAVFDLTCVPTLDSIRAVLSDLGIEISPEEPLALSRDISSSGRSTARVNGRTLTAAALTQLGEMLVDIHGQSDHLSLLRSGAQLELLDRFAGVTSLREQVAAEYRLWRSARQRLDRFDDEQRDRAQRLDALRFQSEEIFQADLQPDEDETLRQERARLANAERLAQAAGDAFSALEGAQSDTLAVGGGLDQIRAVEAAVEEIASVDEGLEALATRVRDALFVLEEVATELRDYAEGLQFDPDRLAEIDERLELIRGMKRKYGPDIASIMAYGETIQTEIETLEGEDRDIDSLRHEEQLARERLSRTAKALSAQRRDASSDLAARVERTIHELNMGRADFEVRFSTQPDDDGIEIDGATVAVDSTGVDRVSFYLAANTGEELRPLARVASGGETARLMLALKSILSDADETPTLVFDEIDVGVGGRSGQVVGEKLWGLTRSHQVIVISHLPQIAAFADRHVTMIKDETNGRTETTSQIMTGDARTDELAMMFDGLPVSAESRANARALLERVEAWKSRVAQK
ncbi:MAG TPA: DNA repair protein RecN [Thermomicrobiales bacterium]|nr:DNA repair protein RecN [Thermomicrobiales bacterium]